MCIELDRILVSASSVSQLPQAIDAGLLMVGSVVDAVNIVVLAPMRHEIIARALQFARERSSSFATS
jgi:hypothetical protein